MTIQTNTTDRKALAQAIAEALHTEYRYLGTPTYAYEVGGFTIDRHGNITGDDFTPIRDLLVANGYITEEPSAATGETTTEEDDIEGVALDSEAPTSMLSDIEEQTITIPAPDITVEQLRNLTYMLYSRQYILNLMTGARSAPCGDTIVIPLELIEALQEALPSTPEDFTRLLNSHKEQGLKGFDFEAGQFSLTFPFYETEPTRWTTFAGLQSRILQAAREATRVFPALIQPDEESEKYIAHMWLQRLGYKGSEMKEQRNILLKHLHGYCAFSNGAKMQNHKDKYSAIRKERRESEQSATEAVEADPSAAENTEEVAGND